MILVAGNDFVGGPKMVLVMVMVMWAIPIAHHS